jgi:hypothetical protein
MTAITGKRWTPEEDAVILANLGLTAEQLSRLIPGRTIGACASRRYDIGCSPVQPPKHKQPNPEGTVFVSPSGIRARRKNGISVVDIPTLYGP